MKSNTHVIYYNIHDKDQQIRLTVHVNQHKRFVLLNFHTFENTYISIRQGRLGRRKTGMKKVRTWFGKSKKRRIFKTAVVISEIRNATVV